MTNRVALQTKFETILGSRHVYFQPPESVKIEYPAIIYRLNSIEQFSANNLPYGNNWSYEVILVDKSPISTYVNPILALPRCKFNRHYVSDNLNHYTFTIYN